MPDAQLKRHLVCTLSPFVPDASLHHFVYTFIHVYLRLTTVNYLVLYSATPCAPDALVKRHRLQRDTICVNVSLKHPLLYTATPFYLHRDTICT